MSGSEYLDTLRDDRAVYLYGKRVQDVTVHPAFRNSARSLARLYDARSEEHTSELQSRENLVCRLLLEKKKTTEESARGRLYQLTRCGPDLADICPIH